MIDNYETPEPSSRQEQLKDQLLSGEIAPHTFLDQLLALDQSTDERTHAIANLSVLDDAQVKEKCEAVEGVRVHYYDLLSLTTFHIAQQKLFANEAAEATPYLERSLSASEEADKPDWWLEYVKATIGYVQNDIEKVHEALEALPDDAPNAGFVTNLYNGLHERGYPKYQEDYRAT